jgi:hypothetical protein
LLYLLAVETGVLLKDYIRGKMSNAQLFAITDDSSLRARVERASQAPDQYDAEIQDRA